MNLVICLLILRVNICVIVDSQKPMHKFSCVVYVISGLCSDSHCTEEHSSMHSKTCKHIREVSTEQKLCSWGSTTLLVALMKFADGSTWVQGGHLLVRNESLEPRMHLNDTEHLCYYFNPLKPELNPICYLLALLGAHSFLHVSRIRVKLLTLKWLMS